MTNHGSRARLSQSKYLTSRPLNHFLTSTRNNIINVSSLSFSPSHFHSSLCFSAGLSVSSAALQDRSRRRLTDWDIMRHWACPITPPKVRSRCATQNHIALTHVGSDYRQARYYQEGCFHDSFAIISLMRASSFQSNTIQTLQAIPTRRRSFKLSLKPTVC
jgi:hypothetical protein